MYSRTDSRDHTKPYAWQNETCTSVTCKAMKCSKWHELIETLKKLWLGHLSKW